MSNVSSTSIVNNLSANGRSTSPQARLAGLDGGTSGGSFTQLLNGYGKPAQPPALTDKQLTAQPVPLPPRGLDAMPSEALTPASTTAPTPAPVPPAYKPETAPKLASSGSSNNGNGTGKTETQRQESKLNNRQSGATGTAGHSTATAGAPPAAASAATQGSPSSRLESDTSDTSDAAAAETAASESTAADSAELASTATTTADAAAQAAAAAAAAAKQPPASTGLQAALTAAGQAAQGAEQAADGDAQQAGDTRANASGAGRPGLAGARGRSDAGVALERAQANAQTAASSTAELGEQATTTAKAFSTELQSALLPAQAAANSKTAGTALEGMAAALGAGTPGELKAAAASAPPTVVSMAQPLFEPAFAPAMAARLSLLAADGVQTAQLHLNPAEMGPVAVQIVVDGQQAQVSFHAEQADTCAVLERSLPDLAAALRDAGLTLSGGGVFQQAPGQGGDADSRANNNNNNSSTAASRARLAGPDSALSALGNAPGPARATRGVLDLYV